MTRTVPVNGSLWVGGVGTIISLVPNLVGRGISIPVGAAGMELTPGL